jgi:hypothetical protein
MSVPSVSADFDRLRSALESASYTSGSTHNFYLYPARFSPEVARAVIEMFSERGDWVLDPFMGGGTAIIEGLTLGRSMVGIDVNALAHFVASVRTRPISGRDEEQLSRWARSVSVLAEASQAEPLPRIANLPLVVKAFMSAALVQTDELPFPRQRAFARCVLLRLGQWALDCRDHSAPSRRRLAERIPELTNRMLNGLREFGDLCRDAGLRRSEIVSRRILLCRDAAGLDKESRLRSLPARPRLVFTSPPYPCVHVLYHRWQVRGRKETAAPYWIAQVPDGYYASHYTGGGRSLTGESTYFSMISSVFSSVRRILAPDAMVVQLVGFANVRTQLPKYLESMARAGFEACRPYRSQHRHLWRRVPNRKWYAKLQGAVEASSELLLFHRPRRGGRRSEQLSADDLRPAI